MKLPILPLGQRDTRWGSKKLGKSTVLTISSDGCLLTCHSMMLTYFGHECTPDVLNEIYKGKNVFDNALINFYVAGTVYDDFKAVEYYNCVDVPCDLSKIDSCLAKKWPVIAFVDNINGDGKPDHFILIIGKSDDGHYIVNDPWTGETYYFDAKWGDPVKGIYGLRIYSGTPANNTSDADKISDLETKVKSLNEQMAGMLLENNTLRSDLSTQEKDNEDLTKQLDSARSEKNALDWEKKQLEIKVKSLEDALVSKESEMEALKIDYNKLQEMSVEGLGFWQMLTITLRKIFKK